MSVLGGQGRHRPALPAASRMLAAPSRMLTQGGALLRAQGAPGLLLLVLEAAAVIKLEVVLYREALQETTDRPALALRAHRGQLSQEGEGEGWALAACPGAGGGDTTCWLAALRFTLLTFLPSPRMALALRGDRAMDRAPFLRCWGQVGGTGVRVVSPPCPQPAQGVTQAGLGRGHRAGQGWREGPCRPSGSAPTPAGLRTLRCPPRCPPASPAVLAGARCSCGWLS